MRDRNNFDLIRFLAAVTVIFAHSYPLLDGTSAHEALYVASKGTLHFGTLAVYVFFIISGYLISMSWERSSSGWAYLRKRIARIMPGYVCAMLFCVFIVAPLFGGRLTARTLWTAFKSMYHLRDVFIPGAFATNPMTHELNGSVWSISLEFKCYLGLMIMGLIGGLRTFWVAACAILCSFYGQYVPYFAVGTIFYVCRKHVPMTNIAAAISLAAVVAAFFFPLALQFVLPTFGAHLLLWFAFQPYLRADGFAKYGDFSYGIYLYAFPIQQMLVATWPHRFTPITLFCIATPLSVLCGVMSWYAVERHFLRRRRHVTDRETPDPSDVARPEPSTATA